MDKNEINRKQAFEKIRARNKKVIYGERSKSEGAAVEKPGITRSMSYAEGRFAKSAKDSDDSFGEDEDIMSKSNMARRGGAFASKVINQEESEEEKETGEETYEFPNIVNIGGMSYETRLEQILD
jgi:hypothetical protein